MRGADLEKIDTRAGASLAMAPQDQCRRQVDKVLRSDIFRIAPMLQQLMQYLTARSFDNGDEPLKEYTIGVEGFGRPQNFDPKTDPIVRVQIHRLRQKLKEYYDSEGLCDPILIEIPKGRYLPNFEWAGDEVAGLGRDSAPGIAADSSNGHVLENNSIQADQEARRYFRPFAGTKIVIAGAVIAIVAAGLWLGGSRFGVSLGNRAAFVKPESNVEKPADPVKAFWATFLGNDSNPVIVYPDAYFLVDNSGDLFRFKRGATDFRGTPVDSHLAQQYASNKSLVAKADQLYYENSYLGFGELKAVGMLSNLFGKMGLTPVVKPSRELSVDDLKQHNVIMLGSSFQNFAVAQLKLKTSGDFSFESLNKGVWKCMIVNALPRANEASSYLTERDPDTQVLEADYSLFTIQPGLLPGRYIANLGGLDTTGSEGAVLYATSRAGIQELNTALATEGIVRAQNTVPTFQALLRTRLEKGYDVLGTSLVTVHKLSRKK
jgi:hypothetical protein